MNILFWHLINKTIISKTFLHCFIYAKYMTSYVCLRSSTISVSTDCILCLDNDYHAGHTKYQEIRLYRIIEIDEICHYNFHMQYSEPLEEMQMTQMFLVLSPNTL